MAEIGQVANILNMTLESDTAKRKKAEAELKQMESLPGISIVLMQLIASEQTLPATRLAAAVALKNFVKVNWNKEHCEVEIQDEERKQLRELTLQTMFGTTGNIRKQLSAIVCLMGKTDFPEEWPELIQVLSNQLNAPDLDKLIAALSTIDELVRRYRFEMKSNELWKEIVFVLNHTAAPLTELFTKMVALLEHKDGMPNDQCEAWLDVLLLIAKIFHSLNSQDLPEFFEDNLKVWMEGFLQLLKLHLPNFESNQPDSDACVLDKLKCCICDIVTLYAQRYEEEVMPYMQGMIEIIWQLLVETDARLRFDTLVNAALGFLSSICQRVHYASMFEADGVLKTICEDVIVKNLMLRECDVEQFQDEPFEYIKRDIEGSDIGTRRRGAGDFVRALCNRFERILIEILSGTVNTCLQEAAANIEVNWMKKDVVYCLVTAMATKAETIRYGATKTSDLVNVNEFYSSHVRGDLVNSDVNSLPILKADAMKYAVTFRNQLAPEHVKEAFDASMKLLTSNHFILHQYAAHTMERVMLVKQKGTQMHLINNTNTKVGPIIAMLFNAFDVNPAACNSHYLMKAMMRSLTMIDAETAKSSGEIVNKLAVMIASAVKNPVDSLHLHLLFESLCILIKQAYFVVEGGIDKYILPLIENVLANDVVEFVPYALQITALLVDQASEKKLKTGTSELESYLPFLSYLMKEELWMRNSNIPAALIVVESFIQSHDEYMLQTHGATLQAIFQRLIGSKALDQHGFYLANALLPFCDKTDKVTSVSLLTPMFRRIQFSKTTKFMKQFILFLCRFAIIRGGAHVCQAIESVQTGMYSMVVEKLLIPELKTMHNTTNFEEKRQCCIGVSNLLAETVDRLGPCYATLIEAIVQLVEGCGQKTLGVGADEEEDRYDLIDTEYNDPFCKLNYAQHNKELAADIKNFKAYLAHSVAVRAVTVKPDSTSCVPESVKAVLSSYAQSSS